MLARRRLRRKSVDAPEVNENIWFLPDLFTSQLGHMSWQVTRVHRPQRWPSFPPRRPRPRTAAEKAPVTAARAHFRLNHKDLHTDGRERTFKCLSF